MKLKQGDKAPQFSTTDINGNQINLSDYADKKVMLAFFRYAGCPWCNLAIHRLTLEYEKLSSKGLHVIAIVQSKKENIMKNIMDRHTPQPPFPIIADPEKKLYNLYGVRPSLLKVIPSVMEIPAWLNSSTKHNFKQSTIDGSLLMVPAQFLITEKEQKIFKAHYGANFNDNISFVDLYDFLQFE